MIPHRWDISPREAVALQRELSARVRVEPIHRKVHTIAGTDCAFADRGRRILAAAVLCDARTLDLIAAVHVSLPCRFPYVPGLLSFREAPATIEAVRQLPATPDLLMCDGQGLAHPRGLGLASHVGLWLDVPTIGVAKSRLCGEHRQPGARRGCRTHLRLNGKVIGAVLRTRACVKPVYVSVGHRITLAEAARWTLRAARRFRLPEPTRRAHLFLKRIADFELRSACPERLVPSKVEGSRRAD
ncbi:MAG TPA: deoxyribonuclease V [Phycisphaerae bacterium]|nr:deoxyribonuclease V [Phycisphaerae bacterium]